MAKHSTPRGMRDEANVGPDPRRTRHLVPLKDLGKFKVAADDPDIRGWVVYTSTGREVGRVDELLVDTDTNEVVMLDIDLRRDDRHTLAPLRAAWIDHAARRVVVDARELGGDELPSLSRRDAVSDEEVDRFDEGYARAYGSYQEDQELRMRHADGELRFHRRGGDQERMEQAAANTADRDVRRDADVPRRSRHVERRRSEELDHYRVADVGERQVRLPHRTDEIVVDRRPVVEEVVVRRREAGEARDEGGLGEQARERLSGDQELDRRDQALDRRDTLGETTGRDALSRDPLSREPLSRDPLSRDPRDPDRRP